MTDRWNRALRSAFQPARELEPTEDEVQRVLAIDAARQERRWRPQLLRPALAVCATLLLGSAAYALPPTRAALNDVYSSIAGWFDGGDGPGRALEPGEDAPPWVTATDGERYVIAENGLAKLYAIRTGETVEFALGGSVGLQDSIDGWRRQLADRPIVSLGPGSFDGRPLDEQGRRPLFGLVAANIKSIELRYTSGPPSTQSDLDGGYVLLADARRTPRVLIGVGASGQEIARLDVRDLELRVCRDATGCPPAQFAPVRQPD